MTPIAAQKEWKRDFYVQLLDLFKAKGNTMFETRRKVIGSRTPRLETKTALEHTAWNCTEGGVLVSFYAANKKTAEKNAKENKERYEKLLESRKAIETAFGGPLDWSLGMQGPDRRISSPTLLKACGANRQDWPAIQADLVDRMSRFVRAIEPHIAKMVP